MKAVLLVVNRKKILNYTGLTLEEWNKRYPNIGMDEIACKCCGILNFDLEQLDRIQSSRTKYGKPYHFNSGCRCLSHNTEVKGNSKSEHMCSPNRKATALDIRCINQKDRIEMVRAMLDSNVSHFVIYTTEEPVSPVNRFIHTDKGSAGIGIAVYR